MGSFCSVSWKICCMNIFEGLCVYEIFHRKFSIHISNWVCDLFYKIVIELNGFLSIISVFGDLIFLCEFSWRLDIWKKNEFFPLEKSLFKNTFWEGKFARSWTFFRRFILNFNSKNTKTCSNQAKNDKNKAFVRWRFFKENWVWIF